MPEMEFKIGVLLTSHPGHRIFMKTCLKYWSKVAEKYIVIMGWDDEKFEWHHSLPDNIELMTTGGRLGLQDGEWWQIKNGAEKLRQKGCTFILKSAADQYITKIESIEFLPEIMHPADFMAIHAQPGKIALGTSVFFCKTFHLLAIIKTYEHNSTIERRLGTVLKALDYKNNEKLRTFWENFLGHEDLQRKWVLKTGLRLGRAWAEGAKSYDIDGDLKKL